MKPLASGEGLKKTCICQGGALTVKDAQAVIARKEAEEKVRCDVRAAGGSRREGQLSVQRCRACGEIDHNARTCQDTIEASLY